MCDQAVKMYRAKQQAEVDAREESQRRADAHRVAEKALLASAAAELQLRRETEQRLAVEKKRLATMQVWACLCTSQCAGRGCCDIWLHAVC
jgi:hypothetical protein